MKKNLGSVDRVIRFVLAVVLVGLYFTHMVSGTAAIVVLILAGILLLTSFISFCPLYLPFGISTRRKKLMA
jgi:hypothetical protein